MQQKQPKANKARKRIEKRNAMQEELRAQGAAEARQTVDLGAVERAKMLSKLATMKLKLIEASPSPELAFDEVERSF
jgi:hypothetical protein